MKRTFHISTKLPFAKAYVVQRQYSWPWKWYLHTALCNYVLLWLTKGHPVSGTLEAPLWVWGEWKSLETPTKLVNISKEHGESEWPAVFTIHSRARSSPRIRPLPSPLPADNGPPLEIPTKQVVGSFRGWHMCWSFHPCGQHAYYQQLSS